VFNKENDISYIGQGIGYTQGLGISYQIDFDTFKELVNTIFKKKTPVKKAVQNNAQSDSDLPSDGIIFKTKKSKSSKTEKANIEGVLNKDGD
jgi:hypothetical protein